MSPHSWKIRSLVVFKFPQEETSSVWGQFWWGLPLLTQAWSQRPEAGQPHPESLPLAFFAFSGLLAACPTQTRSRLQVLAPGARPLFSPIPPACSLAPGSLSAELSFTTLSVRRYKFLAPNPRASDAIGLCRAQEYALVRSCQVILKLLALECTEVKAVRDSRGWTIKC